MRGFLALAGVLVALIVAFLVAWPRLVDVPALRGELARLLREAGGAELRIEGAMRLELLPLPRVAIERAVIGDRIAVGTGTRFTADRIDIELAPLALLAGRIEPDGLQLVRPRLELADLSGRLAGVLIRALSIGPLASVRRIDIVDGAVRIAEANHSLFPEAYDAVDLTIVREGEVGFRLEGSAAVAGEPLRVVLIGEEAAATGPVGVTLRLESGPRTAPAIAEFDGRLTLESDGPNADGTLQLSTERGSLPRWLAEGVDLTGTMNTHLATSPRRLALTDLVVTLAEGQMRGTGGVDLANPPNFDLSLEGTALIASPALIGVGRRLLAAATSRPDLSGRASLKLASLDWRGASVRRLQIEAGLAAGGRPELRHLEAILPGQTALSWTGSAATQAQAIAGKLSLQAGELRQLLVWLGVAGSELPQGGLTSFDVNADATLGADRISLRGLRARLDATELAGSLSFAFSARPRLDLVLEADRLNTALYEALPPIWSDWQTRLEAFDGSLDIAVDRLNHDILRGQGFRLRAALNAGRLDLAELRVANLAGAGLETTGTVDLPLGAWDLAGTLRLPEPKPILRLLGIEPPLEIDQLAPLQLHAESRREGGATSLDLRMTANGAEAALTGELTGAPADGTFDLGVTAEAPDTSKLLLALGWPASVHSPNFGPFTVTGKASRTEGPIKIAADVEAGSNGLAVELALESGAVRPRIRGSVRAPILDEGLVAAMYETLALPLDFPPGSPWLWPGVWPSGPLGWHRLSGLDLDLALQVASLRREGQDLGAVDADIVLSDGVLAFRGLRLPLAAGMLTGIVTLESKGDYGVIGADLRLADANAEQIATAVAPGTTMQGNLSADAALLGQGRSIADLVASLTGTGSIELGGARLSGVELGAAATPVGPITPQLEYADLSGQFAVTAGTLASAAPGLALSYPGGNAAVDARFDLLAWILDARLTSNGVTRRYLGPPGRIRPLVSP